MTGMAKIITKKYMLLCDKGWHMFLFHRCTVANIRHIEHAVKD